MTRMTTCDRCGEDFPATDATTVKVWLRCACEEAKPFGNQPRLDLCPPCVRDLFTRPALRAKGKDGAE